MRPHTAKLICPLLVGAVASHPGVLRFVYVRPHKSFHPLAKAPKPIKRPLLFGFPNDFYQPNVDMTLFSRNGDILLRWPSGNLSPLIPIAADEWLDRAYWEPVRLNCDRRGVPEALQYDRFRGELLR